MPELNQFEAGTFDGLSNLKLASFVNCGFTNEGFPEGIFSDLVSLEFIDFFGNKLTSIDAGWFSGGWGSNIKSLSFWDNPISSIEDGAFDTLVSVE
eukprot:998557_1